MAAFIENYISSSWFNRDGIFIIFNGKQASKICIYIAVNTLVTGWLRVIPMVLVFWRYCNIWQTATAWEFQGAWEKQAAWWTAYAMSGLVLADRYMSIPITELYCQDSTNGSTWVSSPMWVVVDGVSTPLQSVMPVVASTLSIRPVCAK